MKRDENKEIAEDTPPVAEEHHRDYTGSKLGMWLFLLTEIVLFSGAFIIYAAGRDRYPEEFHRASMELNSTLGTLNTVILLTSSLFVALSITAIRRGQKKFSLQCLGLTIAFALAFLVNKYFEWSAKISHGLYPGGPLYLKLDRGEQNFFNLYYIMTGLHGLHVLAGMVVLGIISYFVYRDVINRRDFIKLENAGLYWHLVDIIWIYLFPLFYLIA